MVAVIVYDITRGSFVAPISLAVFEEYFEDRLKTEYPEYQRRFEYEVPDTISYYGEEPETEVSTDVEEGEAEAEDNQP